MKAEWYREDQLLPFHACWWRWKGRDIAHRAKCETVECGVTAARSQLDGNKRAVIRDSKAHRHDTGEVNPRRLARGNS